MKMKGFTLIELMVVVAIIAILAAIAIPAYRDYVTRSKVTELLTAASACKTSVTEYYQSQSQWPQDQTASGCSDQSTKYVQSLTVGKNGEITVTAKVGPDALDPDAVGDVQLAPTVTPTGQIDWTCKGAGTTIKAKYLPAACR